MRMKSDGLILVGQMDNSDGTYEALNRVYDVGGCAPTITTKDAPKVLIDGIREDKTSN